MRNTMRPLVAEFVGTFFLCFPGIAATVTEAYRPGSFGLLGIALAYGVGLAIGVSATMNVSGGHLNPAITIGLLSIGKTSLRTAGMYILAQLLGAIAAAAAVKFLLPTMAGVNTGLGTPKLAIDISLAQGIVLEAIATFLLAYAVMATVVDKRAPHVGGFGVGLTLLVGMLAIGQMTGGAVNPARAFGPALMSGTWVGHVTYWIGPILGSILAMQVYQRVVAEPAS